MTTVPSPASKLNPLTMLGRSSRLTLGTQIGAVLNFAASLLVARTLGPEQFGSISLVTLALLYASFMRLGIFDGGERELLDRLGRGEQAAAERIQRIAFTGELVWSILPALGLLAMSFMFDEPVRRIGFLLAPLMAFGTTLYRMLMRLHLAHQRLDLVAPINALRAIGVPVLTVALLYPLGAFSLLVAPLVVEWILVGVYLLRTPLHLRPCFDQSTLRRLVVVGLPLSLMSLIYWTYRLVGASSVAIFLPVQDLGYYNFVSGPINIILVAFAEFSAILTPTLWSELSRVGAAERLSQECARITIFTTLVACVLVNMAQAGFRPFVVLVAPAFAVATPTFDILAFSIVLLTITFVPGLILDSAVVNRQWQHLSIWVGGLIINVTANFMAIQLGGGIEAIAFNSIWVQLGVVIALFMLAQPFIFQQPAAALRLYAVLAGILTLCLATYFLIQIVTLHSTASMKELIIATVLRVGLVLAIWFAPSVWLWRNISQRTDEQSL
ncbi:lipopolysaccharide biosynthesis protein [Candidatus Chloroploca sp. Khr17]|uniref:lipopolysaccharide biosynthesis protein n=1 Tax=Candidatus Chloroploca sp. Khr17 TaxID=2496869 RepID=UPI00101D9BA3|nr:oligosaccharide flippase family protein [Candidatus Chloroploca sp. Khr17]